MAVSITWNLIGHEAAVGRLRQMVTVNRYPPAILITGSPGTGRATLARRFAAASLCPNAADGNPCGTCAICERIDHNTHPDVTIWSVAAQEIERGANKSGAMTIETVRAISAATSLLPRDAARRFMIIEDADTLAETAQQAMLKTLEEVPGYMTIVLIATRASSLLETIRSRCVEIPLQLVPTAQIEAALDHPMAGEIARLAVGRPGWALRAASNPGELEAERSRVAGVEQWLGMAERDRLVEAYVRGERFLRDRAALMADLATAHIAWRDLLFTALGASDLAIDPDRKSRLLARPDLDPSTALRALCATERCSRDLLSNVRPRLALQSMVNQWPIL
jgi:DNA polymerase III subunit delta'